MMHPIAYIENGDKVTFLWDNKVYMEWYHRGVTHGDVGAILVGRDGMFENYHTFGTIEHPMTTMCTLNLMHNEPFDGPRLSPWEICNPKPYKSPFTNYRMVFLEL